MKFLAEDKLPKCRTLEDYLDDKENYRQDSENLENYAAISEEETEATPRCRTL